MASVTVDFDVLRDVGALEARAARDLADWLAHIELEGKADRTVSDYAGYGCRFLTTFPEHEVGDFTDGDISHFLRSINGTAARKVARAALAGWFGWMRLTRRIPENPMDFVAKMKHRSPIVTDWFTEVEIAALEGLPIRDGALFALLFGSGIRREEARHVQRRHVNLDRRHLLVVKAKGGKQRLVPLLPGALRAIADLDLEERLNPDDHLWYGKWGGKRIMRRTPIADSTYHDWYARCLEEAGVRYLSPHKTRHTYATRLRSGIELADGTHLRLDLDEIQLLLGHASISTTRDQYVHTRVEDVARKLLDWEPVS